MTEIVVVQEPVTTVVEVSETEIVVATETITETIEIGISGPQGPEGDQGPPGTGVLVDELADRPVSADEGDLFAASDTDELYVWFQ